MEKVLRCMKALGDENRARLLMLLLRRELSVCELMAVMTISQPLVSRHLSVLRDAGLVKSRREGKLHFYSLTDEAESGGRSGFVGLLSLALENDETVARDHRRLQRCLEFQKESGRRDVKSLLKFSRQEATA